MLKNIKKTQERVERRNAEEGGQDEDEEDLQNKLMMSKPETLDNRCRGFLHHIKSLVVTRVYIFNLKLKMLRKKIYNRNNTSTYYYVILCKIFEVSILYSY